MRFMTIVKSRETTAQPSPALIDRINQLAEDAVKQGTFGGMGGLGPTALGARARLANGKITVTDGPFTETKELIAGFWLWQVRSKEEAIEWLKRAPFDGGEEVEIRQVFEAEDFGAEFTPELRQQDERQRQAIAKNKQRSGK